MVKNTLAKTGKQTFSNYITSEGMRTKINQIVGGKDGQRFITSIISAVSSNPDLAECEQASIVSAAMVGESLKLSPSPQLGHFYMVPYKDKNRGPVAQFQLGYKGYIQLAVRSGYYARINVMAIKEGELVSYDPLSEEIKVNIIEDDAQRETSKTVGYYVMFKYHNGFIKSLYWSKEKMEIHAKTYSQGYKKDLANGTKYTFWSKDFDAMAFKTMLRQIISKWGIMSIELQTAIEKDMGVIDESGNVDYVDNQEVDVIEERIEKEVKKEISDEDQFKGTPFENVPED